MFVGSNLGDHSTFKVCPPGGWHNTVVWLAHQGICNTAAKAGPEAVLPSRPCDSHNATMSATNIAIHPELDRDVNEWSEDHVEIFLTESKKKHRLEAEDIQNVRIAGRNLLDFKAEDFERCRLPVEPSNSIVQLVQEKGAR